MMIDRREFLLGMVLAPFTRVLGALPTPATHGPEQRSPGDGLLSTDGEIAMGNLDSARRRAWSRFFQDPRRRGAAESVIDLELLTMQFAGDVFALERLEDLVPELVRVNAAPARTALIAAQVDATAHRFADARRHLGEAERLAAPAEHVDRLSLSVDQACGTDLGKVLDRRREIAETSKRSDDLVALGALLVDLGEFAEADRTYEQALRGFRDVSPFPVAWIWFQRGVLWGERVPERDRDRSADCYRKSIEYLPAYTRARVHLAEIFLSGGRASEAEALIDPMISRGDPEVAWRLADALARQGRDAEAEAHMAAAHSGFEFLLERNLLAFADHAAEFYAGTGHDLRRALELARVNVANRPTLRAFEQAHAIAISAGDGDAASELLAAATSRWGATPAFRTSSLARKAQ